MALPWREVIAKPEFQALSKTDQYQARIEYFDNVVAPKVSDEDRLAAYDEFNFFADSVEPEFGYKSPEAKDPGFLSNIATLAKEGAASALNAARISGDVATGNFDTNTPGLIANEITSQQTTKPKEFQEVASAFEPVGKAKDAAGDWTNPLDNLSVVGKLIWTVGEQAVTNPKGLAYLTASQIANMAPSIAGMMAGSQGGAAAGAVLAPFTAGVSVPVMTAVGAVGGAFAGEWPMEAGSEFIGIIGKELSARNLAANEQNIASLLADKQFMETAVSQARNKGSVTSGIDAAMTVGAGRLIGAPMRAAEKAARIELGAAATGTEVAKRASEIVASRSILQKAGNVAGATALDVAGGGLSEAGGQVYAYGKADYRDVGMEMLGEFGGAGIELPSAAWSLARGKGIEKSPASDLDIKSQGIISSPEVTSAVDEFRAETTISPQDLLAASRENIPPQNEFDPLYGIGAETGIAKGLISAAPQPTQEVSNGIPATPENTGLDTGLAAGVDTQGSARIILPGYDGRAPAVAGSSGDGITGAPLAGDGQGGIAPVQGDNAVGRQPATPSPAASAAGEASSARTMPDAPIEAKADEIMHLMGGHTAFTREQVIALINEKGMESADKTVQALKESIKQREKIAGYRNKSQSPATPIPAAPASAPQRDVSTTPATKAASTPSTTPSLTLGRIPNSAEPVTVRNGVVHIGEFPANDYESGNDIIVHQNASNEEIKTALKKAGAVVKGLRFFESKEGKKQEAGTSEKPVSDTVKRIMAERERLARQPAPEVAAAAETARKTKLAPQSRMKALTDERMANNTHRAELERMKGEFGWAERGGRLIRNAEGEASSRTKWIPLDERGLWQGRPDQNVSEAEAKGFVDAALKGEPLPAKGHRFINYLLDASVEREKEIASIEKSIEKAEDRLTYQQERALDALMSALGRLNQAALDKIFSSKNDIAQKYGVRAWYLALSFDLKAQIVYELEARKHGKRIEGTGETDAGATSASDRTGGQETGAEGNPQELSLQSNTEAEVRQKEAARKKEAEAAARREAAPPPEEFTLTGLDRQADIGAVHGQTDLLDQPEAEQPASEPAAPIEDFGEKIEGSRKDLAAAMRKEYSDDEIASLPLGKIWPADFHEKIEDPFIAAVAFAAREEIPSKPRKPSMVKRWVEKVKLLRSLAEMMANSETTRANAETLLNESNGLEGFAAKVRLLEAIDRSQWKRIGNVGEYPNAYRYGDESKGESKKIPSPFVNVRIDGAMQAFAGASSIADVIEKVIEKLGVAPKEAKMQFTARGREGAYFIHKTGDREYRKLKTFTTSKDALDYLKNNYDDLVAAWEAVKERDNVKKEDVRGAENRPRTGADHRNGKDVTVEQFADTFGFRGGQFGKWVSQGSNAKERQWMLNNAYDALMDLADILGIPPRAVSLNGELSMAFGARGSGSASAHYEPDELVINLTKTRGAGTLAHEWFHALDNYFRRNRNAPMGSTRETRYITYLPEARYVHKNRPAFPALTKAELDRRHAQDPKDPRFDPQNWERDPNHPDGVRPEVEAKFAALVEALNESPMTKRAAIIDAGKEEGYWSRIIERAARSFENYIISKMAEKGYHNDYLANVVNIADFKRDEGRYPYLKDEELAPVVEAFDELFGEMQTKETDKGVALFSRSGRIGISGNVEVSDNQSAATALNNAMAAYFNDSSWENAYVQNKLPDSLLGIREAVKSAFDKELVGVTPTERRFDAFNGVNVSGYSFINLNADRGFINIAGHELFHSLERERPDLHAWFKEQAKQYYRNLEGYRQGLNDLLAEGEQEYTTDKAENELLADFAGDALADPKFLAQLAEADSGKFKQLLNSVIKWLKQVTEKLKGNNSEQYIADVDALRKHLTKALIAYAHKHGAEKIREMDKPKFMVAWHGSPHDHDGFNSSMIGTGEGASGFGHGFHFSADKDDASAYRDKLETAKGAGRLYAVEIPDKDVLLNLSAPVSEQSKKVLNALKKLPKHLYQPLVYEGSGMDLFRALEEFGRKSNPWSDTGEYEASHLLSSVGIRGNRHSEFGIEHYIIFNDEDVEIKAKFSRRIFGERMTAHDFIVPETPEFDGNMTGDLAVIRDGNDVVEALPVRLTVGKAISEHRGFGIEHLADNAKRDSRRAAPRYTDDDAENFAREVAAVARDARNIYQDNQTGRLILRSPLMGKALVVEKVERDGEAYYSVVSLLPSKSSVFGDPVWSGRLAFPDASHNNSEPSNRSGGQESVASTPERAKVQTGHFNLTETPEKKQVDVSYRKRRTFTMKDALSESRTTSGTTSETPATIIKALRDSPFVGKIIDKLTKLGDKAKRGGVVIVESPEQLQTVFKEKTGREIGDDVLRSVKDIPVNEDAMDALFERREEVKAKLLDEFVRNEDGKQAWGVIPSGRLIKIWNTFADTGLVHDVKGLDLIVDKVIENTLKLEVNTEMMGHDRADPHHVLKEHLGDLAHEHDIDALVEKFSDYATDEKGNWRISDYGAPRLQKIIAQLVSAKTPEQKLMLVDQALNVVHQRSDLALNFVEGGTKTLSELSAKPGVLPDIRRSENGHVQALFDPKSGLSFLIANRLTKDTAPGVLLHEIGVHATRLGRTDAEFKKILNRIEMMSKFNPQVKIALRRALDAFGINSIPSADKPVSMQYGINRRDGNTKLDSNVVVANTRLKQLQDILGGVLGSMDAGMESALKKDAAYSASANAKFFSDLVKTPSFVSKGYGGLDINSRRVMLEHVVSAIGDNEIGNRIVELIPINMMDMLKGVKLAPDMLLHDIPMFNNLSSVNIDFSVSMRNMALTAIARNTAKILSANTSLHLGGRTIESGSASDTINNRHDVTPFSDVGLEGADADTSASSHIITRENVLEEVAAYLVEAHPSLSISQQIIAWFRNAIRAIGKSFPVMDRLVWNKWANNLTPEDIVFMARAGMKQAARGDVNAKGDVMSRSEKPLFDKEQIEELASDPSFLMKSVLALVENDSGVLKFPHSKATTIQDALKDTFGAFASMENPSTGEANIEGWGGNELKHYGYITHEDGTKVHTFATPLKENFAVTEKPDGRIHINVAFLHQGGFGQAIYIAAADYAKNSSEATGKDKVFVADSAGLSDDSLIRRTTNMLSIMARHGTAKYIMPGIEQLEGDAKRGVPPLKWGRTDVDKFNALAHTFVDTIYTAIPDLKEARYDNARKNFFTRSGKPLDSAFFAGGADTSAAEAIRAGESSIRRAVFLKSLMDSESKGIGERRAVLEGISSNRLSAADRGVGGLFSRAPSQQSIPGTAQQQAQPPRQGNTPLQGGQVGNNASWDSPVPSKLDTFLQNMQDKHIDLKRVTEAIKATGKQIADSVNAYLQEELFHGRTAERTKQFLEKEMTPLVEEMRMRGVKMSDFEEYLWMRHAEERNIQIAKVNPDMPDGGSGVKTKEALEYLKNLPDNKRKAYESLAKRIDAMNKGTRQVWVEYGLESPNTVKAMEDAYEHYVPLMREDMDHGHGGGTGQGFSVKGNATKRATGSNRAVVDILANMALARERAIVRGEKNRVAKALIGLAVLNPNPEFWKVNTPPTIRTVNERTGLVEVRVDPGYKSRDNVVMARDVRDGKVIEYSVVFNEHDERAMRMALSLKNLDQDQIGEWLGKIGSVTRYFASINTQYNPMFGVINIVRDIGSGALNLTTTKLKGKEGRILKDVPGALIGIYSDIRNHRDGKPSTSKWSKLYEEFKQEGGQTGFRDQYKNAQDRTEAIEQALNPDWWMDTKAGKVLTAGKLLEVPARLLADKAVRQTLEWLSDYNEAMENAVRLAAYKEASEMGLSKQESASIAKNLTVNFNRKGRIGREMGALYAFYNASVQGTARMAETLKGPRGKQIIAGGIMLGVVQAVFMAMAGMDDDEPPEFVKDRNVVIPVGDGKYLTVPLPLGFNVLPVIGRSIAEAFFYGKPMKRALHIGEVALDMFNPIGTASVLQTATPTVLDPMAAIIENKDWTGKPIAREDFNSLSPTPGHSRAKDTSTFVSRGISEALNYLTGGDKYRAGLVSPTPDQIGYLAEQVGGGVWRETSKIVQAGESVATGQEMPAYKVPLLGRFYGDTKDQSSQGGKFYQNLKDLNELEAEIKGRRKDHEPTTDIYIKHPEARLVGFANRVENDVQELRRLRHKLIEQNASRERIKIIDMRITAKMQKLNERVKQLEEAH